MDIMFLNFFLKLLPSFHIEGNFLKQEIEKKVVCD